MCGYIALFLLFISREPWFSFGAVASMLSDGTTPHVRRKYTAGMDAGLSISALIPVHRQCWQDSSATAEESHAPMHKKAKGEDASGAGRDVCRRIQGREMLSEGKGRCAKKWSFLHCKLKRKKREYRFISTRMHHLSSIY